MSTVHVPDIPAPAGLCWKQGPLMHRCRYDVGHDGPHQWEPQTIPDDKVRGSLEAHTRAFHAHLDGCPVCRENPFALCQIGHVLLMATALKDAPRLGALNLETS